MARRKRSKGDKPDGEQTTVPSRDRPAPDEVRVFPFELRSGEDVQYWDAHERIRVRRG
jgi:hypothetical protein